MPAATASVLLAVDATSKLWALDHLTYGTRHLWGPIGLQLAYDAGSVGDHHPMPALLVTVVHASVLLGVLLLVALATRVRSRIAAALVVGGLLGNWLDLATGNHHVVDFVAVGSWQVVNFADLGVTAGALLLAFEVPRAVLSRRRALG